MWKTAQLPCSAEPTLGLGGGHQPSVGPALPGLPVQCGQIFTTLRNACGAMLAPTCPHQVPIAFHAWCGKQLEAWAKNHHARKCLHRNARTHLSTPSSHHFPRVVWKTLVTRSGCRSPWWAHGETVPVGIYQSRKQQGPPMAGLVVHVLQGGAPYSALPPNLWVYCRLIVRPTLSNQDTS